MLGYIFWTISDNWEWADGYGPKFGLVAVDRSHDLARTLRQSYHLFSKVYYNPLWFLLRLRVEITRSLFVSYGFCVFLALSR